MNEDPLASAAATREMGSTWVQSWEERGYSYWLAEPRAGGSPVGMGGVRHGTAQDGSPYLNLGYRFDPAARGKGYAREVASAATTFAMEWLPEMRLVCKVAERNVPSVRAGLRAGCIDVGLWPEHDPEDPDGAGPEGTIDRLMLTPVVVREPVEPGSAAYDEILDLWQRVNNAGGAVGFEANAPRAAVASTLDRHLADCANGVAQLVRIAEPTPETWTRPAAHGALIGFGFITLPTVSVISHRTTLLRVMVDPDRRGHNFGRLLVAALHAQARAVGREIVDIGYRGGTGLGEFYESCGYVETGRVPGGLRFSFGTRDDVHMARRLDGLPLGS